MFNQNECIFISFVLFYITLIKELLSKSIGKLFIEKLILGVEVGVMSPFLCNSIGLYSNLVGYFGCHFNFVVTFDIVLSGAFIFNLY